MNSTTRQRDILKKGGIRVRFAPSPTGFLHIGGVRTALFNFLFARKLEGKFILRVEDTDLERSQKHFEEDIIQGLEWLGIAWDEGVFIGGPHGPYRQSERKEIYKKYIQELLDKDLAYHCFCTEEELEAMKQDQMSRGEQPRYSGRCSHLQKKLVEEYIRNQKPSIIRFRTPAKKVAFEDAIRGKLEFDAGLFGDVAIAKNIAEPLYNLAVAIDDHLMHVTDVIRGEEHLSNTPKQILLQEALGFPHPRYTHLSLILAPDRSKLSKRHGSVSIVEYKKEGYLPEALINFLALLGWNPGTDQELFTMQELISAFDMKRVQKSGAIFSIEKLKWFNAHYIQKKELKDLVPLCIPFLISANLITQAKNGYSNAKNKKPVSAREIEKIILVAKDRMKTLADSIHLSTLFFIDIPEYNADLLLWKNTPKETIKRNLVHIRQYIHMLPEKKMHMPDIEQALKEKAKELGVGETLWPLRVALSGLTASPGPHEIIDILEKEKTLQRIDYAIAKL